MFERESDEKWLESVGRICTIYLHCRALQGLKMGFHCRFSVLSLLIRKQKFHSLSIGLDLCCWSGSSSIQLTDV